MARQLHDSLGHYLSLITVQSSVALNLNQQLPEQARAALATVKQASKDALGELRSALNILRQDGEPAPRSPAPALARLCDLVAQGSAPGLEVRAETEGTVRPLPFAVDVAAYRIVQEALTNVTRHAGPATATVRVTYGQAEVTVQVDDDGCGRRPPSAAGQRQRDHRHAASALPRSAASSTPAPRPAAASGSGARLPLGGTDHDPGPARRRPGAGAGRLPRPARRRARHRGRRRGRRRRGGRRAWPAKLRPDVVLMDIRMPGLDGLEATRQIAADPQLAGVRVLILTTFELDEYVFEAIRCGASGFLVKDTEPDELRAGRPGGRRRRRPAVPERHPAADRRVRRPGQASPTTPSASDELTDREREVLALVAEGLSNDEIAERLFVSPATAKTHVSRAMIKLRRPRPGPARGHRLRVRTGPAGLARLTLPRRHDQSLRPDALEGRVDMAPTPVDPHTPRGREFCPRPNRSTVTPTGARSGGRRRPGC